MASSNDPAADEMGQRVPSSRLEEIWRNHEAKMKRLDQMELKVEEHVIQKRRRILNLMQVADITHRRSTMRLFVTHTHDAEEDKYTLTIEGRLLIGHLDHASSEEMDKKHPPVVTDFDPSDRNQYRGGMSEMESPVEKMQMTGLMDRLVVKLQTVHTTNPPPRTAEQMSMPRLQLKSKSRGGGEKKRKQAAQELEPERPLMLAPTPPAELFWSRKASTTDSKIATAPDSQGWRISYKPVAPTTPDWQIHSVVCTIHLLPHRPTPLFKPSQTLASSLFPLHCNEKKKANKQAPAKKAKLSSGDAASNDTIPTELDSTQPATFTMGELIHAFHVYCDDRSLIDENGIIRCNTELQKVFQREQISFSELQELLKTKQLIMTANSEPLQLTYIMKPTTATNYVPPADAEERDDFIGPVLLQLDTDVYVESLLPYRSREILRRLKQREFGYTSSRTKAKNWLVGQTRGNEALTRVMLDDCVLGYGVTAAHGLIWRALARAAPSGGEAEKSALCDAKIAFLMDQIQDQTRKAKEAWDIVDAMVAETSRPTEE